MRYDSAEETLVADRNHARAEFHYGQSVAHPRRQPMVATGDRSPCPPGGGEAHIRPIGNSFGSCVPDSRRSASPKAPSRAADRPAVGRPALRSFLSAKQVSTTPHRPDLAGRPPPPDIDPGVNCRVRPLSPPVQIRPARSFAGSRPERRRQVQKPLSFLYPAHSWP
jgi:hypothetical protein